jgi:hypothetical protein
MGRRAMKKVYKFNVAQPFSLAHRQLHIPSPSHGVPGDVLIGPCFFFFAFSFQSGFLFTDRNRAGEHYAFGFGAAISTLCSKRPGRTSFFVFVFILFS